MILAEFLLAALGNFDPAVPAVAGNREVGGRGNVDAGPVLILPPFGGGIDVLVRGRGSPLVKVAWAGVDAARDLNVNDDVDVGSRFGGKAGGAIEILPAANLAVFRAEEVVGVAVGLADRRLAVVDASPPNALVVEVVLPPGLVRADRAEVPVPGCGKVGLVPNVAEAIVGRVIAGRVEGGRDDLADGA